MHVVESLPIGLEHRKHGRSASATRVADDAIDVGRVRLVHSRSSNELAIGVDLFA